MNRIHEVIKPINALPPKAQEATGNDTTAFIDGAGGTTIDFVVTYGALAAGKKITAELLGSGAAAGTSPEKLGETEVKAPTGGVDDGTLVISTEVKGDGPRYFGVKIANDAAAAVLVSVVALVAAKHSDENNDFDVLMVQ